MLGDKDKRAAYDRFGHAGVGGAGGPQFDPSTFADFGDLFGGIGDVFGFGDIFGGGGGSAADRGAAPTCATTSRSPSNRPPRATRCSCRFRARKRARPARALARPAGTSPEQCGQCGGSGQLRYQQGFFTVARPCGSCRGTGRVIASPCGTCRGAGRVTRERKLTVRIPAGVATGQRMRLSGEGEHGTGGGPQGDLYVVFHVADHAYFHREGDDLHCEVPVQFTTLALGGTVNVPTLDGTACPRDSRGHAAGHEPARSWQGHAQRVRAWPRRPARDCRRPGAEEAVARAARGARGAAHGAAGRYRRRRVPATARPKTSRSSSASRTCSARHARPHLAGPAARLPGAARR